MRSDEEIVTRQREIIDKYGQSVVGVFPTKEDEGMPFTYTIGRHERGLPELFINGALRHELQAVILNSLDDFDRANGLKLGRIDGFLEEEFPAYLVKIDPVEAEMNLALRMMGDDIEAWQFVWPDDNGHFPWDSEWMYDEEAQYVLGEVEGGNSETGTNDGGGKTR